MNLNMNPKLLHMLAEAVQILGTISVVASLPGLSLVAPWVGVIAGVSTGISTVIKSNFLTGNIPAAPTSVVAAPVSTRQ